YWKTGPEEICPKCLEYGCTSYKGCKNPSRCYICAGSHEASAHKCPITGCTASIGKACIHLPLKCIHCKGAHQAIFQGCPKRREAIEEAKRKSQAAKDLAASRKRIQVVIPVKKKLDLSTSQPHPTSNQEQESRSVIIDTEMTSQDEAILQQQLCC